MDISSLLKQNPDGTSSLQVVYTNPTPNVYQASPTNPTATTSTTGVMMGLAGAITPTQSGKIQVTITGNIANSAAADGWKTQIRYGTGTAPANAAALTGTAVGTIATSTATIANAGKQPFSITAIVSGLTLNTAVWLDVSLAAITAGTATATDISISAVEL